MLPRPWCKMPTLTTSVIVGARIHQSTTKLDKEGMCLLTELRLGWTAAMQATLKSCRATLLTCTGRVIEHAHGGAEQKFRRWLYLSSMELHHKAKLKQIFREANTAYVIAEGRCGCWLHDECTRQSVHLRWQLGTVSPALEMCASNSDGVLQ
jgi:hypothetical protein